MVSSTFMCANPSTQRFNDLFKQNHVSLESKNKSSIDRQHHLKVAYYSFIRVQEVYTRNVQI